jgi:hypothetical protein
LVQRLLCRFSYLHKLCRLWAWIGMRDRHML